MSASTHRIYFLLQRVAHRLKKEADGLVSESGGLTTAQAAAMSIIAAKGPVNQQFVAKLLMQRESALSTMVARLLKAGYITRTRSKSDGRAWELTATALGHQAVSKMSVQFSSVNQKIDSTLSESEISRLAESLESLLASFGE